jgi:hypothetical protein
MNAKSKIIAGIASAAVTASAVAGAACAGRAEAATPEKPRDDDRNAVASVIPSLCYAEQEAGTGFCVDRSICSGGCFHGDGSEVTVRKWYELNQ